MHKKLIAFCDSPTAPTGFAQVSREILSLVHSRFDVDITIWGINHRGIGDKRFNIFHATDWENKGEDWVLSKSKLCKEIENGDYDLFWSVQDAFNMSSIAQTLSRMKDRSKFLPSIFYFPVDTPSFPIEWSRIAMRFDHPVAYTKFGKEIILNHMHNKKAKSIPVAYHGVNVKTFYEISEKKNSNLGMKNYTYMEINLCS